MELQGLGTMKSVGSKNEDKPGKGTILPFRIILYCMFSKGVSCDPVHPTKSYKFQDEMSES